MNRDQIEGTWTQVKGRIKERWGNLTDDRLDELEGQWDQLAGLVQKEYGMAREDARRALEDLRYEERHARLS